MLSGELLAQAAYGADRPAGIVGMFGQHFRVVKAHGHLYAVELLEFDVLPYRVADKEHHRVAVVDDMLCVLDVEVLKYRHYDRAICDGGHI